MENVEILFDFKEVDSNISISWHQTNNTLPQTLVLILVPQKIVPNDLEVSSESGKVIPELLTIAIIIIINSDAGDSETCHF